ncbi:MAG: tRNA (adenosine(37)-N6)-threonylcarbamoyltransferase complex ATPase subunit type 1 TsaE [Tidjanibacter sp.]|nr:tRNA (adenosine(37)-N6)-threonylcarbamoyltransferase complex ATPase subunit type 1 TsaE [Tidjanibacter sp.]
MKEIEVDSLGRLPDAAQEIVGMLDGRNVVAFFGPMGAGKTTLIREICAQMGVTDTVTSPTFALINQYNTEDGRPIYHFDFYRINRPEEAFDLGYEEYFYGGDLCLVEWPEKVENLLPDDTLRIRLTPTGNDSRLITIE